MARRWGFAALLMTAALANGASAEDLSKEARREKLREAIERQERLDRRARELEDIAAHPPPQPIGMSDGPRDGGLAVIFKDARWKAQLKREAAEAKLAAAEARTKPDRKKVAKLRAEIARLKADEKRLTALITQEQKKEREEEATRQADMEKAFRGVGGVGLGVPDGGTPARIR